MTPYPLTYLTLVLGPPLQHHDAFVDFQERAARGESVTEHPWAQHEYAALDALTHRDGAISTHTLFETFLGSVLQVGVIVADVERQWVRHADQQLYAALTVCSEDVRPRAGGIALHDPAFVEALNAVAHTLATLDGRAWMSWSSHTVHDTAAAEQAARTATMVRELAELVTSSHATPLPATDDIPFDLVDELLVAITQGRTLADTPYSPLARELRALRHLDPLRTEWARITMDAFYLGALDITQLGTRGGAHETAGLAYLYLGKERSDRLKADPFITPRFRGEIAAKTLMTAYALERLAPSVSRTLCAAMSRRGPRFS